MPSTRDGSATAVSMQVRVLAAIVTSAAMAVCGCDERREVDTGTEASGRHVPARASPPVNESSGPLRPLATIRCVRDLRSAGRYSAVERYLLPDQRGLVVRQLRAGDRLPARAQGDQLPSVPADVRPGGRTRGR